MQSENNKHIAFYVDKRQKRDDGRGGSIERCNATSRGANNGFILSATPSVTGSLPGGGLTWVWRQATRTDSGGQREGRRVV